ncbi:acyloxyacyl hydrolase [Pseudoalteromonas sp. SSDWG2]|uniref:acyloxyacyl hydrolase n=1 Tax=Pseudoalteromonas sp. SSDWG2 TaxID=3139391 RepID=UPI003BAAE3D5
MSVYKFLPGPYQTVLLCAIAFNISQVVADEVAVFSGYTLGANDDDTMAAISYSVDTTESFLWSDGWVFTYGEFHGLDKYYGWADFSDVSYYSAGLYWSVWQSEQSQLRFEFAPTYVDSNYYYAHYVGSRWHFMSSASYRYDFAQLPVFAALRYQHTSNGGLAPPNPGVDGLGLQVGYRW